MTEEDRRDMIAEIRAMRKKLRADYEKTKRETLEVTPMSLSSQTWKYLYALRDKYTKLGDEKEDCILQFYGVQSGLYYSKGDNKS